MPIVNELDSSSAESASRETAASPSAAAIGDRGRAQEELTTPRHHFAILFAIAAWIIPGLGHLLLGRWGRACAYLFAVGGLAMAGLLMRGKVFPVHSADPFGALGFLADAGTGFFYALAHLIETSGPDLSRAAGDYGTQLFAAGGIANVLSALDAYEISSGRRS